MPIIAQGVELEDADAGSICSHGFYHAFMASFNRLDKLPKAREFCDSLKSKEHGAKLNCYHGIGHGATFTAVEEFGIKDTEELVYSVRELCANTLENDLPKVYWCLDGLYSGLMDTARKDVYPDFVLLENPYDMCLSESEEEYKRLCYYDLGTYVVRRPGQEINPEDEEPFSYFVASAIRSPNVIYKRDAIKGLGASYFLRREKDQKRIDDAITYCQALPFEHKRACIEGMVWGIAEIPASGYHFEEASKLCDNGLFKEEERDICYLEIITKLGSIYSLEETIAYCNGFDKELYKNTCLEAYENYEVSSAVNQELPTSYYAD